MAEKESDTHKCVAAGDMVVVHKADGTLIKGRLECEIVDGRVIPSSSLPAVLHVRGTTPNKCFLVPTCETKAVFFVKRYEGIPDYDEVRFFSEIDATDLWIRIRFADGEVIEGQTENGKRLLIDSGVWLRPLDSTSNNILIYVPKDAVAEFHVMGVAVHRNRAVMATEVEHGSAKINSCAIIGHEE